MGVYMNWSGGKDSALALYALKKNGTTPELLLTSVNATHDRVSMHGVRRVLLEKQAKKMGIPLETLELPEHPDMETYNRLMAEKTKELKERNFTHAVFGDIFLEDLRKYREERLQEAGLNSLFPLWKEDSHALMNRFIDEGFRAIVVCVNDAHLDASFCGRELNQSFLDDLPPSVDPCGENGEYHSFVFDGPVFAAPVSFQKGEMVRRTYPAPKKDTSTCFTIPGEEDPGFYFLDLLPVTPC